MERQRVPSLGCNQRQLRTRTALSVGCREQRAHLRRDADAALLLQDALAKDVLERKRRILDGPSSSGSRISKLHELPAFEHELPVRCKTPVQNQARGDEKSSGTFLQESDRTDLHLDVALLRHRGVGRVEWPIRPRGARQRHREQEQPRDRGPAGSGGQPLPGQSRDQGWDGWGAV